ncbi:MAG: hypothetical protein ACI4OI_07280, partial [Gemmiger sp.]
MRKIFPDGKKTYLFLLGAAAVVCLAVGLALLLFSRRAQPEPAYLLKDHAGKLALYTAEGAGPLAEYEIYTRLLPERDLLALQQRVAVADEA